MKPTKVILYFLTLLGEIINLTQMYLQIHHESLCSSNGCKIVDSFARYGNGFMCGVGAFVFLLLFAFLVLEEKRPFFGKLFDLVLMASLAGEGYLLGFQLFGVGTICHFCFGVFLIFVTLGVFRILHGSRWVWFGYWALLAVLVVTFFVPPKGFTPLPKEKFVLIYSPSCPHCKRVIELLKSKKIRFAGVNYRKVLNFLYTLGDTDIPVLVVRGKGKFTILVGEVPITAYVEALTKGNSTGGKVLKVSPKLSLPSVNNEAEACSIFNENCNGSKGENTTPAVELK